MEDIIKSISLRLEEIKDENDNLSKMEIKNPPKSIFCNEIDLNEKLDLNNYNPRSYLEENLLDLSNDSEGNHLKLNNEQKNQFRTTGKFDVDSKKFPGQKYTWQLSKLLQKGTNNIKEDLFDNIAKSYSHLLEFSDFIYRNENYTIFSGIKSIASVPKSLCELFLGLKTLSKDKNDSKIKKEVSKKLIVDYDRNLQRITFNDQSVDYTLDKYTDMFYKLNILIKNNNPKNDEEYHKLIKNNFTQEQSNCIIDTIQKLNKIRQEVDNFYLKQRDDIQRYKKNLEINNNIRGRSSKWVKIQVEKYKKRWNEENSLDDIISNINLIFKIFKEIESVYNETQEGGQGERQGERQGQGEGQVVTEYIENFYFHYWNSNNYIIDQKSYFLNKYYIVEKSSSHIGWRLNIGLTYVLNLFNNANYYLVNNLFYSQCGLRSLFGIEDFKVGHKLNSNKEIIHAKKYTPWFGRFKKLFKSISVSRKKFEDTSDTGFLGKTISRVFNRIYNYIINGCLGSLIILFGHPIMTIINTVFSLLAIATSPIWCIICGIVVYLFSILIYDKFGGKFRLFSIILKDFLIKGIGKIVLCSACSVFYIVRSILSFAWSLFTYIIRYSYDTFLYYTLLKYKARIPSSVGFASHLIKGPGLSSQYYNLITSDLALLLIEYELEVMVIEQYKKNILNDINKPYNSLMEFYDSFKAVELIPEYNTNTKKQLYDTKIKLEQNLNKIIKEYWDDYPIKNLNSFHSSRMTKEELNKTLILGSKLCKDKFPNYENLVINLLQRATNNKICIPIEDDNEKGFEIKINTVDTKKYIQKLFNVDELETVKTLVYNPIISNNIETNLNNVYKPFSYNEFMNYKNSDIENKIFFQDYDLYLK